MQQTTIREEGWRQLQDRIENLVGHLLKTDDVQRIEYKAEFAVPLLELPSAYRADKQGVE